MVKPYTRVSLGKIGAHEAYTVGHGRCVLGLHPGLVRTEYPKERPPSLELPSFNNSWRWVVNSLLNFV